MFLSDLIVSSALLGSSAIYMASKMIRTKVPRDIAEEIENKGLYHFTSKSNAKKNN